MSMLLILLAAYMLIECICQAQYVDKGGRICQFFKLILDASLALRLIYVAFNLYLFDVWFLVACVAVSLTLLPSTYYRLVSHFDRRLAS